MSQASETLLQEALLLPPQERKELAEQLLQSIEKVADDCAEWEAELERRVTEVREGKAELIDGEEVFAAIKSLLVTRRDSKRSEGRQS